MELRSSRVLIEPASVEAARGLAANVDEVSSWFIDEVRSTEESVHYVFAAAMSGSGRFAQLAAALPADGVAVADTLATRLGLQVGDELVVKVPVLGRRKQLDYREASFGVDVVYPLNVDTADPSLMPPIPGMVDADTCSDWQVGLPIELSRVGPVDEHHWQQFGGSPSCCYPWTRRRRCGQTDTDFYRPFVTRRQPTLANWSRRFLPRWSRGALGSRLRPRRTEWGQRQRQ